MDYVKKFLHVGGTIGQGAFGKVLVTSPVQNQSLTGSPTPPNQQQRSPTQANHYALKCVHPILKPQRLVSELRFLRDLGGTCNVVQMHTAHFQEGSLFIVMELIEHDRFVNYVADLDYNEIVLYMKNLLIALEHIHKNNVVHRDIKPANFLFNRKNKKFLLVDFGLAQRVRSKSQPLNANTRTTNMNNSMGATSIAPTSTPTKSITTGASRRSIAAPLFPEHHHHNNNNHHHHHNQLNETIKTPTNSIVNIHSTSQFNLIKLPQNNNNNNSPQTPNVSTKRHLPELQSIQDCSQMLKKVRVTSLDESREPIRLTVGAYESPITYNDAGCRRNTIHNNHKFSTPTTLPARHQASRASRCACMGKPTTCPTCVKRPDPIASKSGTPGYKAPEVLLRSPNQTTAIDIWSAGHIFASLLAGHTPIFRDTDDTAALADIVTVSGSHRVCAAARAIGINLNVRPKCEPRNLADICTNLRTSSQEKRQMTIPKAAFDLLEAMLEPNPYNRFTATDCLKHLESMHGSEN